MPTGSKLGLSTSADQGVQVLPFQPGQPTWQLGTAESTPSCIKLRVSKRADPGVQVLPFPLSRRNRTWCPAATEIRID